MKKMLLIMLIMITFLIGCSNQNEEVTVKDEAEEVINRYITAITNRDYSTLVELYGGDYDWLSNFTPDPEETNDKQKVFENYLTTVLPEKILLDSIVNKEVISDNEVVYSLTFKKEDGSQFEVRTADTRNTEFKYKVQKIDDKFKVMDPPPYQP